MPGRVHCHQLTSGRDGIWVNVERHYFASSETQRCQGVQSGSTPDVQETLPSEVPSCQSAQARNRRFHPGIGDESCVASPILAERKVRLLLKEIS